MSLEEALAKQAYEACQYNKAVELYKKAIKENPDSKVLFAELAQSLYRLNEYEDAILAIKQSLELEGDPTQLYLIRGKCLYSLGHHAEAKKSFHQALENVADERIKGEILINLGRMYLDQNNSQEALLHLQKGVALDPQSWYGHHLLAFIYNILGQAKEARREILISYKLNPSVRSLGYLLFLYTFLLLKILLPIVLIYAYGFSLYSGNLMVLLALVIILLASGLFFISKGKKKIGVRGILLALFVFLLYAVFWIIGR